MKLGRWLNTESCCLRDSFFKIFSALIAYNFAQKKPSLKNNFVDTKQLILFQ